MSFAELNVSRLLCRNLRAMGYREPRPIQGQAIGPIRDGRDVIGLAKTGTGKTAAFIVPVADQLLADKPSRPGSARRDPFRRLRALVLCPTRELAMQVEGEARRIVQGTLLRTACVYGRVGLQPQAEILRTGIDLLVATPGRIRELHDEHLIDLTRVRHLVIDEADRMFDMGFLPQVRAILDLVAAQRQIALFTATFPKDVETLAEQVLRKPVRIEVDPHTTTVDHVEQHLTRVEQDDKIALLLALMGRAPNRGVLVFCRTRRRVGWVASALKRHGMECSMLHGDRTQAQRLRALAKLQDGTSRIVVATDVASRGLHIPAVQWVINYDLPNDVEAYVHRIGRAGHGGVHGVSWTFITRRDETTWVEFAHTLDLHLPDEAVEGFTPTSTSASENDDWFREAMYGEKDARRRRKGTRPPGSGRRRKQPIAKGETPGGGVRRRGRDVPGRSAGQDDGPAQRNSE